MLMSLGPERGSVDRMIRSDQDALMQLLQLGLVVVVSVSRWKEWGSGAGMLTPEPPSHSFSSRAPRRAKSQTCQSCSVVSSSDWERLCCWSL